MDLQKNLETLEEENQLLETEIREQEDKLSKLQYRRSDVEDEIMEVNENEQFPPQNTTNANTRKTLKRPRNNNNNNQPRSKRNIISGRKSRYANNKTYRKK